MKYMLVLALVAIAMLTASAASTEEAINPNIHFDASEWATYHVDSGDTSYVPWVVGSVQAGSLGKVEFDARWNFDQKDTATLMVGKTFGNTFAVTPKIGFLAGDFDGATAEVDIYTSRGRLGVFGMNQYGWSQVDYLYLFYDVSVTFDKHVSAAIDWQVYHEPQGSWCNDVGPAVRVNLGHGFYTKVWGSVDPANTNTKKVFVGFGFAR